MLLKDIGQGDQPFINCILQQMYPNMKHLGDSTYVKVNSETQYYSSSSTSTDRSILPDDVNFENKLWYIKVMLIGYKIDIVNKACPMWQLLVASDVPEM